MAAEKLNILVSALDSFRCCKDADIETFLRHKAFQFLERGWCSVYLILNEDAFDQGHIQVEAYFTLSHKSLSFREQVSKTKIKNISGGFKDVSSVPVVLIGQLGKYMEQSDSGQNITAEITAYEILDMAFEVVKEADTLIPCRCVLVECSSNPKVQKVYRDYDFQQLQYEGEHYQFYKKI